MTIEQKALERRAEEALTKAYQEVDEWRRRAWDLEAARGLGKSRHAAEMREQAERFSEAVRAYTRFDATKGAYNHLCSFILPAADPLVEAIAAVFPGDQEDVRENVAESIRAALEARGLAIVKKEAVNG